MKVEPNGRYQWHGIFLSEDGEEHEFAVFADDFEAAAKEAIGEMPGEIVFMERGEDVSELSFDVNPEEWGLRIVGGKLEGGEIN